MKNIKIKIYRVHLKNNVKWQGNSSKFCNRFGRSHVHDKEWRDHKAESTYQQPSNQEQDCLNMQQMMVWCRKDEQIWFVKKPYCHDPNKIYCTISGLSLRKQEEWQTRKVQPLNPTKQSNDINVWKNHKIVTDPKTKNSSVETKRQNGWDLFVRMLMEKPINQGSYKS